MSSRGRKGPLARDRPPPRAPLLTPVLSLAVGIVLDRFCAGPSTLSWCLLALSSSALALWAVVGSGWSVGWRQPFTLIAVIAIGGAWHHRRWSDLDPLDLTRSDWSDGRVALVRGVLTELALWRPGDGSRPGDEGTTRSILAVTAIGDGRGNWSPASGRVRLIVPGDRTDLEMGWAIEAAGTLREIQGPRNPGESDPRAYLRAEGVRLNLTVAGPRSAHRDPDRPDWPWHHWVGGIRTSAHERLAKYVDPPLSPMASALLLGRREAIDPRDNDAFVRTGTMHLLAISGLHLQVLAALVWIVLRALGARSGLIFWSLAIVTGLYAGLVGWMPSVLRSVVMTWCGCLAGWCGRPGTLRNVLAMAALAALTINPSFLFDVGCQLSFLGVAGLGWALENQGRSRTRLSPIDALERTYAPSWVRACRAALSALGLSLWCSLAVWLLTLPLVVSAFRVVPTAGILLNLPLVPITSAALLASGLTLFLSTISEALASWVGWFCSACLRLAIGITRQGAEWPWGHWFEPGPPIWWVIGFYGLLAFAVTRRRLSIMLPWLTVGVAIVVVSPTAETTEADVLAVDHGLAVLVRGNDGRTLLFDCGRMGSARVGRWSIAPALWSRGVRRIDHLILSHADSDHFNGLDDLMERFAIGEIRVPPGFGGPNNPEAEALLDRIRVRRIPLRLMVAGDTLAIGSARATALHPPSGWRADAPDNARCLVIALESMGRRLLLTGDVEGAGLDRLIASGDSGGFDEVVAPHHGGRLANPPAFYRWARPGQVIVSQARPRLGRPDVVASSSGDGLTILRTWERGAVQLRWEPGGIVATPFLQARVPFEPGRAIRWSSAILGVGIGLLGGAALASLVFGAWFLVAPSRVPDRDGTNDEADGWNPIETRAGDGTALRGAWLPASIATDSEGPRGWVILLHGMGEDGRALAVRGRFAASLGWHVLRPDSRGTGRSEGQFLSYGARESADVRGWIDALPADQSAPLVLWGRSMGAAIALKTAVEDEDDGGRIGGLILEAPYADLIGSVAIVLRRKRVPGVLATGVVRLAERLAGIRFARPSPLDLAPSIVRPSLILIGGDDPIAPVGQARALAGRFGRRPEVLEVPGAGHADVFDESGKPGRSAVARILETVRGRSLSG